MRTVIIIISIFMLILPVSVVCASDGFEISGRISYEGRGSIYIMLTDEKSSAVPFEGIEKAVIEPGSSGKGFVEFRFCGIPAGEYGIRCFQDVNGNGRLDRGLFGPSEPWGMSWSDKKMMPPDFDDYSFRLESDLSTGDIVLKK